MSKKKNAKNSGPKQAHYNENVAGSEVKHTYKFYKDRKDNPKWRPAYLKARQQRIIIGTIGISFLLLIGSISFLGYSYSNAGKSIPTTAFDDGDSSTITSSYSTQISSSSTENSSSSSKKELKTMDNLDLNTKIAIFAQAYYALNSNTTIMQAPQLAMSNSWDNGTIEWYDSSNNKHKLDVRVNGDTITYSYIDTITGQPTTQTASVNESLNSFYSLKSNMEFTQTIANKCVAPAYLKPSNDDTNITEGRDGGFAGSEVYAQIVNKGFKYQLIRYDGMTLDKAMENGAPQNLAHDGSLFYYYFKDNNIFEMSSPRAAVHKSTDTYTITNQSILLGSNLGNEIPLKIHDGVPHIQNIFDKVIVGHTFTYSFVEDSYAKTYIDSK